MSNELSVQDMKANLKKYRQNAPVQTGMQYLKFDKGAWFFGRENDEIDDGATFIIAAESLGHGLIAWHDRKVEHEVRRKIFEPLPSFADLPQIMSEEGFKPQVGFTLAGLDGNVEGKTFSFWTQSKGGISAHTDIVEAIEEQLDVDEDAINPIVTLGRSFFPAKDKDGNPIKVARPVFKIVGWTATLDGSDLTEEQEEAPEEEEAPKQIEAPQEEEAPKRRLRRAAPKV